MNDSYLTNRERRIIARVDGNTLHNGAGCIVAIYHSTEDVTSDRTGRSVGKGDQRLRKSAEC